MFSIAWAAIFNIYAIIGLLGIAYKSVVIVKDLPAMLRYTSEQIPDGYQLLYDQFKVRENMFNIKIYICEVQASQK
jgi:hypothetical protein